MAGSKNGSTGSGVLSVDDAFGVEEALLDLELRSLRSISSSPGARLKLAVSGSVNSCPSEYATPMSASACYHPLDSEYMHVLNNSTGGSRFLVFDF